MEDIFQPNHLLQAELIYELAIRGVVSQKPIADKRKILGRLLGKERQRGATYHIDMLNYTGTFDVEKTEVLETLGSIAACLHEFEGATNQTDSTFARLKSRISHVSSRARRILVPDDRKDEVISFKNESYATSLKLEADLFDKLTADAENLNASFATATGPVINVAPPVISYPSAMKPLSEWGVRFSGDSKNVYPFIERITELALSRKVSESDLFNSAVELFIGDAFVWYRSVRSGLTNWTSLIIKLKEDFLPPDAEDDIWEQIKHRKQRRNETVAIFIAQIENLFSRLPRVPAEVTKVRRMRQNLLPEYVSQLALVDIASVSELCRLGRKLEEAANVKLKNKTPSEDSN